MSTRGDIFGQRTKFGGAFKASLAGITFSTDANSPNGGLGLLVQNFNAQYQQQVNRVWELSPEQNTYYVVGRSQGNIGVGRIVGPRLIGYDFIDKFSDACRASENIIRLNPFTAFCYDSKYDPGVIRRSADQSKEDGVARYYVGCLMTGLSTSIQAQDMLINDQLQLMYSSTETTLSQYATDRLVAESGINPGQTPQNFDGQVASLTTG